VLALGWGDVVAALRRFDPVPFALVALLSFANYGLRFRRWDVFLRAAGATVPRRSSLAVYFAAYVMVITPGKVGEMFKAGLLQERHGVPVARGLAVVVAERIFDFLAVLVLVGLGLAFWDGPWRGSGAAIGGGSIVLALVLAVRSSAVRRRLVARAAAAPPLRDHRLVLDDALATLGRLFASRPGGGELVASVLAWFCECGGLWLICRVLAPDVSLGDAVFVYAAATLAGSASFLPGGLGGTEAGIVVLLELLGVPAATGAAVAFIVRLATLWLAVGVGLAALIVFRSEVLASPPRS